MAQILKQISTNAFVSLGCNSFKKMLVTNTGTNACDFNLAAGVHKTRSDTNSSAIITANTLEGDTSISDKKKGFYFLRSINIPAGVTLELTDMSCLNMFVVQHSVKTFNDGKRVKRVLTTEDSPTVDSKPHKAKRNNNLIFFASLDDASDSINIIISR